MLFSGEYQTPIHNPDLNRRINLKARLPEPALVGDVTVSCNGSSAQCSAAVGGFRLLNGSNGKNSISLTVSLVQGQGDISLNIIGGVINPAANGVATHPILGLFGQGPAATITLWPANASIYNYSTLTATHEFGHALGLGHQTNITQSIMSYSPGRSVTSADI